MVLHVQASLQVTCMLNLRYVLFVDRMFMGLALLATDQPIAGLTSPSLTGHWYV